MRLLDLNKKFLLCSFFGDQVIKVALFAMQNTLPGFKPELKVKCLTENSLVGPRPKLPRSIMYIKPFTTSMNDRSTCNC